MCLQINNQQEGIHGMWCHYSAFLQSQSILWVATTQFLLSLSCGSFTGIVPELISQYFTMGMLISPRVFSSPSSRRKQSSVQSECFNLGWAERLWWGQEAHTLGLPRQSQPRGKTSSREPCEVCWRCGGGAHNHDWDPDEGSSVNSYVIVSPLGLTFISPSGWVEPIECILCALLEPCVQCLLCKNHWLYKLRLELHCYIQLGTYLHCSSGHIFFLFFWWCCNMTESRLPRFCLDPEKRISPRLHI